MGKGEKRLYLPRIEWEGLQDNWHVDDLEDSPALPLGSESVELWRDAQYKVKARVTGTPTGPSSDLLPDYGEPGTIVPRFEVCGSAMHGAVGYELDNCTVGRVSVTGGEAFEGDLTTYHVRKTLPRREPLKKAWLTEWYLNGYRGSALVYPRIVHTEFREEYRKRREFLDEDVAFDGTWWKSSRPCALVETADFGFVLQPIPEGLGPSWSECMGIEYREDLGGIPEPEVREAIADVVSFVMGRPLVSVGHTVFNAHGYPVEQVAKSPLEENLVAMCRASEQPPVRLDKRKPTEILEVLLREMVPSYLELKDQLNLDQALWGYWLSEHLPLGANLPELSTSVEIMKKAWFKRTGSKSQGVYMPKRDFDKLLEDELAAVETKLAGVRYGERILRRICAAYNMGSNESLEFFFEEINLSVGEVEWDAIKARNPMAHGSSVLFDEAAHEQMVRDTFAYRTLFNRILLRILGYEGDYVDRSVPGWPERPLEEPMGGTI